MDVPILQRNKQPLNTSRLHIPAHRILHLELLLLLVELTPEDVLVDRIDDQVFKFSDIRHVQSFEEVGVG